MATLFLKLDNTDSPDPASLKRAFPGRLFSCFSCWQYLRKRSILMDLPSFMKILHSWSLCTTFLLFPIYPFCHFRIYLHPFPNSIWVVLETQKIAIVSTFYDSSHRTNSWINPCWRRETYKTWSRVAPVLGSTYTIAFLAWRKHSTKYCQKYPIKKLGKFNRPLASF